MKIAIISDIHDNLPNLNKCLTWCNNENAEEIICCGDITHNDTLRFLALHFRNKIHLVSGNVEIYKESEVRKYENMKFYGKKGIIYIEDKTIGFCHEPEYIREILKKEKCSIVFYGHTHKPWEEEKDGVRLINPGNISGTFQKSTFAVLDGDDLKLIMIEEL